jgi:hypothetical protein
MHQGIKFPVVNHILSRAVCSAAPDCMHARFQFDDEAIAFPDTLQGIASREHRYTGCFRIHSRTFPTAADYFLHGSTAQ